MMSSMKFLQFHLIKNFSCKVNNVKHLPLNHPLKITFKLFNRTLSLSLWWQTLDYSAIENSTPPLSASKLFYNCFTSPENFRSSTKR